MSYLLIFLFLFSCQQNTIKQKDIDPLIWRILRNLTNSFAKYHDKEYYNQRDYYILDYLSNYILDKVNLTNEYFRLKEDANRNLDSYLHLRKYDRPLSLDDMTQFTVEIVDRRYKPLLKIKLNPFANYLNSIIFEIYSGDKVIVWRVFLNNKTHIGIINYCSEIKLDCNENKKLINEKETNFVLFESCEHSRLLNLFLRKKLIMECDYLDKNTMFYSFLSFVFYYVAGNKLTCDQSSTLNKISSKHVVYSNDIDCLIMESFFRHLKPESFMFDRKLYIFRSLTQSIELYVLRDGENLDYLISDTLECYIVHIRCVAHRKGIESAITTVKRLSKFKFRNYNDGVFYETFRNFDKTWNITFIEKRFYYVNYLERELRYMNTTAVTLTEERKSFGLEYYTFFNKNGRQACAIVKKSGQHYSIFIPQD